MGPWGSLIGRRPLSLTTLGKIFDLNPVQVKATVDRDRHHGPLSLTTNRVSRMKNMLADCAYRFGSVALASGPFLVLAYGSRPCVRRHDRQAPSGRCKPSQIRNAFRPLPFRAASPMLLPPGAWLLGSKRNRISVVPLVV